MVVAVWSIELYTSSIWYVAESSWATVDLFSYVDIVRSLNEPT